MVLFKAGKDVPMGIMGLAHSLEDAKAYKLPEKDTRPEKEPEDKEQKENTFLALHDEAAEAVATFRSLHRLTKLMTAISAPLQFKFTLEPALNKYGSLTFTDAHRDIYKLHHSHSRAVASELRNTASGIEAAYQFPKLLLIALISDYDVFIQKLIKTAFMAQPQLQSGVQRNITLPELSRFSTIEEALDYLIERDIDGILYEDHSAQLKALNKLFNIKVDTDSQTVTTFLELCERRNLYTHNAGRVNSRYLSKCVQFGCDVSKLSTGQHLDVTEDYLNEAVLTSHELKIKLCQYVWRKIIPEEQRLADEQLNQSAFKLLQEDEYSLAERILEYGIKHTGKTEQKTRLMMIVNHANALKLSRKKQRAISELDKIDWSASSDSFQISVAAIKDDLTAVTKMMGNAVKGGALTESDFRTWPVFKASRSDTRARENMKEVGFVKQLTGCQICCIEWAPHIFHICHCESHQLLYRDADAYPVKDEAVRVAARHGPFSGRSTCAMVLP